MAKQAKPVYTAYFKRSTGQFTLQKVVDGRAEKLFIQLEARSGAPAWKGREWVRGKSAIPVGTFRLWTDSLKEGKDSSFDGIGEFFRISTGSNPRLIMGSTPDKVRQDIGLHWENKFPGSAGCIVLVDTTEKQKTEIRRLFKFLRELPEEYIALKVFD